MDVLLGAVHKLRHHIHILEGGSLITSVWWGSVPVTCWEGISLWRRHPVVIYLRVVNMKNNFLDDLTSYIDKISNRSRLIFFRKVDEGESFDCFSDCLLFSFEQNTVQLCRSFCLHWKFHRKNGINCSLLGPRHILIYIFLFRWRLEVDIHGHDCWGQQLLEGPDSNMGVSCLDID